MDFRYLELSKQSCPLCGGVNFTQLKNNDRYFMGISTVGCNQCGLVQTNPRPSQSGLGLFYKNDYRRFYQGVVSPDLGYINLYNKKLRLKTTCDYLSKFVAFDKLNVTILDIGCSEGALFSSLRDRGFMGALKGVEPNAEFANYAAANNRAIVVSSLEEITGKYDLVTLNHVYEHLLDPGDFLIKIKGHLKINGLVYIDVPDAEEYSSLNDLHIAHVFHFTTRTIIGLLNNKGFEILSCEKYAPINHPKSIRVVAKVRRGGAKLGSYVYSPDKEIAAWVTIRRLSVFKKRIKELIKRIPGVVYFHRHIKKYSGR